MINMLRTQYVSLLSGFRKKFSYKVANILPGYSLNTGNFIAISTVLTFDNPGSVIGDITQVQVKLDGLETFYRKVDGFVYNQFPSFSAPQYEIGIMSFFTPTQHTLYVYIANQTGGTVTIPAFTIRYTLDTYDTPFQT